MSELPQGVKCFVPNCRDGKCLIPYDQRIANGGILIVVCRRVQHGKICQLRGCIVIKKNDKVGIRIVQKEERLLAKTRDFTIELHAAYPSHLPCRPPRGESLYVRFSSRRFI